MYARISPVSGEKKGVFLEITTGEYLERNTLLAFGLLARRTGAKEEYSLSLWRDRVGGRGGETESVGRNRPTGKNARRSIAVSASVHGVQREEKRANVKRQPPARKNARESA